MGIKIAPSVLSADMADLKGELDKISKADLVHFDVMDGHFTQNLTFGVDILKAVKRSTDVPVDVHMMVSNPDETADWYADAGADITSLTSELSNARAKSITFDCSGGRYFYYAYPKALGTAAWKVGGFDVSDNVLTETTVTNEYGLAVTYYVYRSKNLLTDPSVNAVIS